MRNGEEAQTEKEREARRSVVKVSGLRIQPAWGGYIYDVHRWLWKGVTEKQIIMNHDPKLGAMHNRQTRLFECSQARCYMHLYPWARCLGD